MRARRARWVVFWVFAVALVPLVPIAYGTYPPVGILVGVIVLGGLAFQVRAIRYEERREAAREPQRSDGEPFDTFSAIRLEPGRMPEDHGPGDPEVELVLGELPGDDLLPRDLTDPRA
jgi:hypothetical protein